MTTRTLWGRIAPLAAGLGMLLQAGATIARAQAATQPAAPKDETVKLEELVVTGSHIPVAAGATAVPVTVISSATIERTGVATNALDLIKKSVPQFVGNANIGAENANISSSSTGGGSQAQLRNLTTLALINGRRAAVSPISATGGYQFVDLNILPMAAISSIQVLLDGASATYGSDATSGVINIITRHDYQGAEVGGFYEVSDNTGSWETRGGSFVMGAGNGKTSITLAGGWSKQDPLFQYERPFSETVYGTPTFGGTINIGSNYFVLNPSYSLPPVGATKPTLAFSGSGANSLVSVPTAPDGKPYFGAVGSQAVYWGKTYTSGAGVGGWGGGELAGATGGSEAVAFNLAQYVTLLQHRESRGAMATFEHKLSDNISLFGDLLMSKVSTQSQINAQPVGTTPDFNVTPSYPDNPFNNTVRVRNRFVTNPRVYKYDTDFVRLVAGFKGDVNEKVSYETAINLNESQLSYKNPGVIDSAGLLAAAGINPLAGSSSEIALHMFQRSISPGAVAAANFVGTAFNDFKSALYSWDGRLLWKAAELPGGTMSVVFGAEYNRQKLSGTADLNSIPDTYGNIGWTGATSVNPFSASRKIWAGFIETKIPIAQPSQGIKGFHTMEATLSGRYEDYSDTSNPFVPKISFRWLPVNDEFGIRGSWGKSFNAPTLYNLFGPSDVGFTPEVQIDPHAGGEPVSGQAQIRGGSNPLLKPARSKAWNLGVVYSPNSLKGFSVEATYFNIKERDIVGVITAQTILQSIEDLGPASPYIRNLPNGQPNPAYAGDPNNPKSYDARIEGFGADGAAITAPGQVADQIDTIYLTRPLVNIATQSMWGVDLMVKYRRDTSIGEFDASSSLAYIGSYKFDDEETAGRATTTSGTIPRWSTYTQIGWTRGGWGAWLGNRYIPGVPAPLEEELENDVTRASAYTTVDLGASYSFDKGLLNGLKISLSVQNMFNKMPPVLPYTFSDSNADIGTYDPRGRTFLLSARYKF